MATGTGPIESQDILNKIWNPAGTAPAANPDSANVYLAGGSAMVGSGSGQVSGQPFVVVQPSYRQFILDTTTLGSAAASGTATTGLGAFKVVDVHVNIGSMTGTISFLDILVDSRIDGTDWVNLAHLAQVTSATGSGYVTQARLVKNVTLPVEVALLGTDAGAGTIRNIGWGDDLRIRRTVSGGTTAPIFTYTVTVNGLS